MRLRGYSSRKEDHRGRQYDNLMPSSLCVNLSLPPHSFTLCVSLSLYLHGGLSLSLNYSLLVPFIHSYFFLYFSPSLRLIPPGCIYFSFTIDIVTYHRKLNCIYWIPSTSNRLCKSKSIRRVRSSRRSTILCRPGYGIRHSISILMSINKFNKI